MFAAAGKMRKNHNEESDMEVMLCVTVIAICNNSESDTTQRLTPPKLACIAAVVCCRHSTQFPFSSSE